MKKPIGITAKSGEICPESGVWKVQGYPSAIMPIGQGKLMPSHDGHGVQWELLSYAL